MLGAIFSNFGHARRSFFMTERTFQIYNLNAKQAIKFSEENQRNWHSCKNLLASCLTSYISQPDLPAQIESFMNIFVLGISDPKNHGVMKLEVITNAKIYAFLKTFSDAELAKASTKTNVKPDNSDYSELQKKFNKVTQVLDQEEVIMTNVIENTDAVKTDVATKTTEDMPQNLIPIDLNAEGRTRL